MKWILTDCKPGDMIRIRVGAIYHYGVYCSDDEVIEFGEAPLQGLNRDASAIRVMRVDIDAFACGKLVEVASLERAERRRRIPPKKTVELARARVGEGGYDILKNNCEHFANECVFGEHICKTEQEARRQWREREALDLYAAELSEELPISNDCLPKQILRAVKRMPKEQAERELFQWKLLTYAASKSFAYEPGEWKIKKGRKGLYIADRFSFSLCMTEKVAFAAISHKPLDLLVKEFSQESRGALSNPGETTPVFCGVYEANPLLYLAVRGESARMTLVWRYEHATGRTLKKLLPAEQVTSL